MKRTVIKTVAYKALTSIELAAITYFMTGSAHAAGSVGAIHTVVSTVTFAGFEHVFGLAWNFFSAK